MKRTLAALAAVVVLVATGCTTAGLDEVPTTAPSSQSVDNQTAYLALARQQAPSSVSDARLLSNGSGFCNGFTEDPSLLTIQVTSALWESDGFTPYAAGWTMGAAVVHLCPAQRGVFLDLVGE